MNTSSCLWLSRNIASSHRHGGFAVHLIAKWFCLVLNWSWHTCPWQLWFKYAVEGNHLHDILGMPQQCCTSSEIKGNPQHRDCVPLTSNRWNHSNLKMVAFIKWRQLNQAHQTGQARHALQAGETGDLRKGESNWGWENDANLYSDWCLLLNYSIDLKTRSV